MSTIFLKIKKLLTKWRAVHRLVLMGALLMGVSQGFDAAKTATFPPAATTPTHLKVELKKVELQSAVHGDYTNTVVSTPATIDLVANTGTSDAKFSSGSAPQEDWHGVRLTLGSTGSYTGTDPCTGDSVTDATITLPNATDQGVILQYQVPHPVLGVPTGAVPAEDFTLGSSPINLRVVVPVSDSVICASDSAPLRLISGSSTELNVPFSVYLDTAHDEIGVTDESGGRVTVFQRTASGDVSPIRSITGANTGLNGPSGIAVDDVNDEIAVSNIGNNSITFYNRTDDGNQPPKRVLQGDQTGLRSPGSIYVSPSQDEIGVVNGGNNSIIFYGRTDSGNQAPTRYIQGPDTGLAGPCGIAHDGTNDEVFVTNTVNNSITVYNDTDGGANNHDVPPKRVIEGRRTGLNTPCGISVDPANSEIVVSNVGGNSITLYSLDASGDAFPVRRVDGNATGLDAPSSVAIDSTGTTIVVSNSQNNTITTHDLTDSKPFLAQTPVLLNSGWEQMLYAQFSFSGTVDRVTGAPLSAPAYDGYRIIWKITSDKLRQPADATSALLVPPTDEVFTLADGTPVSHLALGCNAFTPFSVLQLSTNCPPSALILTPYPPESNYYHVPAVLFGTTQDTQLKLNVSPLSLAETPRLEPTIGLSTNDSILGITWKYYDGNNSLVKAPLPLIMTQQLQINLTQGYKAVSSCYTQVSGNTPTLVYSSPSLGPDVNSLSDIKNNRCDIFLKDVATMTFTVTDAYDNQYAFTWTPN